MDVLLKNNSRTFPWSGADDPYFFMNSIWFEAPLPPAMAR